MILIPEKAQSLIKKDLGEEYIRTYVAGIPVYRTTDTGPGIYPHSFHIRFDEKWFSGNSNILPDKFKEVEMMDINVSDKIKFYQEIYDVIVRKLNNLIGLPNESKKKDSDKE